MADVSGYAATPRRRPHTASVSRSVAVAVPPSPFREPHLANADKYKRAAADPAVMLPAPPPERQRKIPARPQSATTTPRRPTRPDAHEPPSRVSLFGTTPRDSRADGFDMHGSKVVLTPRSDAPGVGEYSPEPRSFQSRAGISFPTSPRWGKNSEARDVSPGPQAYTPRQVRPRTACAAIGGKSGRQPISMHHGAQFTLSKHSASETPGVGAYSPDAGRSHSARGPVSISKSPRRTGEAGVGSTGAVGPGAYESAAAVLKATKPRIPSATMAKDSKGVAVLRSVNSLFYTTDRLTNEVHATPGVGAYTLNASSLATTGASTFSKAPRDGRSPSPHRQRTGSPSPPATARDDVDSAPDQRTLSGRAARNRGGFTMGKQRRDLDIIVEGSKTLYKSTTAASQCASGPGVGTYAGAFKRGTMAEAAADARRKGQRSPSPTSRRVPADTAAVPGPGAYAGSDFCCGSARSTTHNRFLKEAMQQRLARFAAPVSRGASRRASASPRRPSESPR